MGSNSWNGYERNCMFTNVGGEQFVDTGRPTGSDHIQDSRSTAVADFDGDGRLDMVVQNNAGAPVVFMNNLTSDHHWFAVDLQGRVGNRDGVGTRVRLKAGGVNMSRYVSVGSGYASQRSNTLHFGLGDASQIESLEVVWPNGNIETIEPAALKVDTRVLIVEGEGLATTAAPATESAETPVSY